MSGHSKFANIKHKKEKNDAAKGKIFTRIGREIAVAVKEGGSDPNNNSKLKDIIAKAKANNMPNDTIDRSIKKAAGEGQNVNYEFVSYEGYGPSGIAIIVDAKEQLDLMWKKVDEVPNIKYVLVLCYTGMRLSEMLGAMTENYSREEGYFITGVKTAAGKDRVITISPKIRPFFAEFGQGKHLFTDLSAKKFRSSLYYPALQALDMDALDAEGDHIYTPHCCRHTFATLMKNVNAPATDKQKLIGHAKFEMTAHYTHTDIDSLKKITDNI